MFVKVKFRVVQTIRLFSSFGIRPRRYPAHGVDADDVGDGTGVFARGADNIATIVDYRANTTRCDGNIVSSDGEAIQNFLASGKRFPVLEPNKLSRVERKGHIVGAVHDTRPIAKFFNKASFFNHCHFVQDGERLERVDPFHRVVRLFN